jgi:hypothetical protein
VVVVAKFPLGARPRRGRDGPQRSQLQTHTAVADTLAVSKPGPPNQRPTSAIIVAACLTLGCGGRSELIANGVDEGGSGGGGGSSVGPGGGTPGLCPPDMTEPVVLEGDRELGGALALHGDNIYYSAENEILRMPKAGGESELLTDGVTVGNIAIDDDTVFFTSLTPGFYGYILRMDLDGGGLTFLTPDTESMPRPYHIVVSETHVYWSSLFGSEPLKRVPKTGGVPEPVEWPVRDGNPLAIDDTYLYWGDGNLIYLSGLDTTDIGILADLQSSRVDALEDDDTFLYARAGGLTFRIHKRTGDFVPLDSVASPAGGMLALDGERVYWTNYDGAVDSTWAPGEPAVFSLPDAGASRADVVAQAKEQGVLLEARAIAVDDSCVYWAQGFAAPGLDGIVFRTAK